MAKKLFFGCLGLFVFAFLVCGGLSYWFYKKFTGKTPEQVAQMVQEMTPGARAPNGFTPSLGVDLVGMKMAGFENKSSHQQIMLIMAPISAKDPVPTREQLLPSLKVTLAAEDQKRARSSSQESTLQIKGQPETFPFLKRLVTQAGQSKWEWNTLAWAANDRQHVVMIQAQSPQNLPQDKFVQEFMLSVQLKPFYQTK